MPSGKGRSRGLSQRALPVALDVRYTRAVDAAKRGMRPGTLNLLLTFGCLILAAALRVWVVREHPPWAAVFSDMAGYVHNADQILSGKVTSQTFFQPVGFPAFLALLRKIGLGYRALAPIHVVLGTLTVYLAGRIAARLDGERTGLLTTFVLAVHWSLAYMSGYYMGETLYAFLITLMAWLMVATGLRRGWHAIAVGAVLGISYWIKGYSGPMLMLMLAYFGLRFVRDRGQRWRWFKVAFLLTAVFATQPALHREVTFRTTGDAQWGASTSGLNLVEGKCPWKRNEDSSGYGWWSPLYVQQHKGAYKKWPRPFTDAKYFQQQAIQCIKDNPKVMVESVVHVAELFVRNYLWPASGDDRFRKFEQVYEKFFLGFVFPGLVFGFWRLSRSIRAQKNLFVLAVIVPILTICGVVYIGKSEIRYRLPFDPFFCIVASAGWISIGEMVSAMLRAIFARSTRGKPSS